MTRKSADTDRFRVSSPALKRPCWSAFLFPLGAPVDLPPCIRHLPLFIAGDLQRVPFRVFAPKRGLRCIGNLLCMGLILNLLRLPTPRGLDHTDNSLAASMHMTCSTVTFC